MSLQGRLGGTAALDVFERVARERLGGVLAFRCGLEEIQVFLHEGLVIRAEHLGRRNRDLFGNLLLRSALIDAGQLQAALEEQRRTLRRLGEVLATRGLVAREALRELALLQLVETVFRVFRWESGRYSLEPGPVSWDREASTPVPVAELAAEALRRPEEWPRLQRALPSMGNTFESLRAPRAATTDELDAALDDAFGAHADADERLGPNERRVLRLVTPGRTLQELVDRSRIGEFATCEAVVNLVETGYLRSLPARPGAPGSDLLPGAEELAQLAGGRGRRFGRLGLGGLAAGLALAASAVLPSTDVDPGPGARFDGRFRAHTSRAPLVQAQLARLQAALELHRLERGAYPERLDELVAAGLVRPDDVRHPFSEPYHYVRMGERGSYVLVPPLR